MGNWVCHVNITISKIIEKTVKVSSTETAEATKLMENIFRAVNIAMVNELKLIFERMNINIWEVIEAADSKQFGFMPFYPGPLSTLEEGHAAQHAPSADVDSGSPRVAYSLGLTSCGALTSAHGAHCQADSRECFVPGHSARPST